MPVIAVELGQILQTIQQMELRPLLPRVLELVAGQFHVLHTTVSNFGTVLLGFILRRWNELEEWLCLG